MKYNINEGMCSDMGNASKKRKTYNAEFKEMVVDFIKLKHQSIRSAANMVCLKQQSTNGSESKNQSSWITGVFLPQKIFEPTKRIAPFERGE